jgi:hypothetical protein
MEYQISVETNGFDALSSMVRSIFLQARNVTLYDNWIANWDSKNIIYYSIDSTTAAYFS